MKSRSFILVALSILMIGQPSDGWVTKCLTCTGEGDDSPCAVNNENQLESVDCNHEDTHNMFCIAKRDKGVWERRCCQGANNCIEVHDVNSDRSTTDISVCQEDDCNFMDPRQNNDPASHVTKCHFCEETGDSSDCAIAEKHEEKECNMPDFDNEYCFVSRNTGKWERGCCSGTEDDCKTIHQTNADASTFDKVVCHNDMCNTMDPSTSTGPTEPSPTDDTPCSFLHEAYFFKQIFLLVFFWSVRRTVS